MSYVLNDGSESKDFKIGDQFRVIGTYSVATEGSIVRFSHDDGSFCPLFELISGNLDSHDNKGYIDWGCLVPHDGKDELETLSEDMPDLDITLREGMYVVKLSPVADVKTRPMNHSETLEFCKELKKNREWLRGYLQTDDDNEEEYRG